MALEDNERPRLARPCKRAMGRMRKGAIPVGKRKVDYFPKVPNFEAPSSRSELVVDPCVTHS